MSWIAILTSEPAITILMTAAAYGLVALFHWLQNSYHLDGSRWSGLIADAYNFAEKEGLLRGLDGGGKLSSAIARFAEQYAKVYSGQPTLKDLTDATLDLAKLAFQSKFAPTIPAPSATVTTQ
jgi:hypothetical protein